MTLKNIVTVEHYITQHNQTHSTNCNITYISLLNPWWITVQSNILLSHSFQPLSVWHELQSTCTEQRSAWVHFFGPAQPAAIPEKKPVFSWAQPIFSLP